LITEATGVPGENIQIGGTHTHSSPAVGGNEELTLQWKPVYMDALVSAAKKAIADLAPATMYGAKAQTENLTFVRHYLMENGRYAQSSTPTNQLVDYATKPNEELLMVKFDRPEDKKDIKARSAGEWNLQSPSGN
jgi:hypothetical protein